MNFKTLTPGTPLNTDKGPAEFICHKPNNLKGQTVKVRFIHSGKEFWYSEQQLRSSNNSVTV